MENKLETEGWELTRINQGYQMTRVNGDGIECRSLNWFEKIRYFFTTITNPTEAT